MKKNLAFLLALPLLINAAHGQGTYLYDQESTHLVEGSASLFSGWQPVGQSFLPSLSGIGFVQLYLYDGNPADTTSGMVRVNVRSGSITGTILGTSAAVEIPDGFFGVADFTFGGNISLTAGTTYYLQPYIESGTTGIGSYLTDTYPNGTEFLQGNPIASRDLWFREGMVVPEPSTFALLAVGAGILLSCRRKR